MSILYHSLRRLRRTPVQTIFFFLLLSAASALLAAGGGLWKLSGENRAYFEAIFQTIGTVEQKPERIVDEEIWDAETGMYRPHVRREYGETIPVSVLSFDGADYISGPEQRAWYSAYVPEYLLMDENEGTCNIMIVEASPLEDAVPAGPVAMEVRRILYTFYPENAPVIYYCDHNNAHPEKLYAGHTYVMCLVDGFPHGWPIQQGPFEYIPYDGLRSTQAGADGRLLDNDLSGKYVEEVTPGFYETENGKAWLELAAEYRERLWSVPVTATDNTDLILPFYDQEVFAAQGRGFTEEDYAEGRKVCMVSRRFANRNGLQVGAALHLRLRYANYADSASGGREGALTASGRAYSVWEDDNWEICGIYDMLPGAGNKSRDYRLADNEVIIPASSVRHSDADHIAAFGPMKGYTTSFEIPNGSIDRWMELWQAQGIDGLEITFYDRGYSRLEEGLKQMERMALLLLAGGGMSAFGILVFFCHLFITKQSMRTAIERSLGMRKGQCLWSLLSGILVIALCGVIAGSIAGYYGTTGAAKRLTRVGRFDRRYSNGALYTGEGEETTTYLMSGDWRVCALTGSAVAVLAAATALVKIRRNLRREPLALLSGREV